jgi:kinesin family protein 1
LALPGGVVVEVGDDQQTVTVTGKPPFVLDVVFAMESTQLGVFERIGIDIVQTAYNGYNASMFAYGQTSSGKSFSMMGVRGTELVGLIPRIANLLFYTVSKITDKEFFIQGSYLEIYNEKLRDLLGSGDDLKVRENPELGVHVAGLTKVTLSSSDMVEKLIEDGTGNRTVAATKYNSESSRSHAVFELHCQQKYKDKNSGEEMQSKTKIALIDLAGSERSDKLGSVGKALQEGNNINKSLTVLGRCIKALVEKSNNPKKKVNVPFRESVLTYYLRESLAGNARTTMLAAVSPAGSNEEETMSTLRYAASAKKLKTSAKKNEDPLKAKVRELSAEVEQLRAQLASGGGGGVAAGGKKKKAGGEDADQLVAALKGGEGQGALHDQLSHLDGAEKEAYLKELEEQMELLGLGGFSKASADAETKKKEKRSKRGSSAADPRDIFPQLSMLNKDDLMSHAMFINFKVRKLRRID